MIALLKKLSWILKINQEGIRLIKDNPLNIGKVRIASENNKN